MIAESGVHTRAQGAAAELAGADAILVGSALMQAPDPAAKLRELLSRPLVKVCGLTRQEDVDAAVEAGADLLGFILVEKSPRRAPAVLDVPDDRALRRRLRRGRRGDATPTSSSSIRDDGGTRARPRGDAPARRPQVARVLDQPWEEPTRRTGARPRTRTAASCSPAGSARTTSARRSPPCARGRSTRRRRSSASPGSRITTRCAPSSRRHG